MVHYYEFSRIEEVSGVHKVSGRHAVCYASLRISF